MLLASTWKLEMTWFHSMRWDVVLMPVRQCQIAYERLADIERYDEDAVKQRLCELLKGDYASSIYSLSFNQYSGNRSSQWTQGRYCSRVNNERSRVWSDIEGGKTKGKGSAPRRTTEKRYWSSEMWATKTTGGKGHKSCTSKTGHLESGSNVGGECLSCWPQH